MSGYITIQKIYLNNLLLLSHRQYVPSYQSHPLTGESSSPITILTHLVVDCQDVFEIHRRKMADASVTLCTLSWKASTVKTCVVETILANNKRTKIIPRPGFPILIQMK